MIDFCFVALTGVASDAVKAEDCCGPRTFSRGHVPNDWGNGREAHAMININRRLDQPRAAVADDFFLVGHSQDDGRLMIQRHQFSIGVAGAILAELLLGRHARAIGGDLEPLRTSPSGDDVVDTAVLAMRRNRELLPAEEWIQRFRHGAYDVIANRLSMQGVMVTASKRRLLRSDEVVMRPDTNRTRYIRVQLRSIIARPADADDNLGVLAALVLATGIAGRAELTSHPGDEAVLRDIANQYSTPGIAMVVHAIEKVRGDVALRPLA